MRRQVLIAEAGDARPSLESQKAFVKDFMKGALTREEFHIRYGVDPETLNWKTPEEGLSEIAVTPMNR